MRGSLRLRLSIGLGVLVALALPAAAWAHGGGNVFSPPTATPPVLDGNVGAGEWAGASAFDVVFGTATATIRFERDATYLYVGAIIQDPTPGVSPHISIDFDDNHDGVRSFGEDTWIAFLTFGQDFFYNPTGSGGPGMYNDLTDGGTAETDSFGTVSGTTVQIEMRHPLCSADTAHDICASDGQTLGIDFQYESDSFPGDFVNAPGPNLLDPSNNWADLTIGASPLQGSIAFESNRDGNSEIWSMNPDGSLPKQLTFTSAPVVNTRPAISPDGNLIAFERGGDSKQIWEMNADGSNAHALTTSVQGLNGAPAFSPDGTKIAFESTRFGKWQILVMNADGSSPTRVTQDAANDVSPSWNAAGTMIAYDSDVTGNRDVWTINAAGGGATNLTNNPSSDTDADWSPDGPIIFVSDRSGVTSVWKMDADGGNPQNVTGATIYDADPSWSADGHYFAFVRDAGGQAFDVWTARPDGSGQTKLTAAPAPQRNSFPDWGPVPSAVAATIALGAPATATAGAADVPIAGIPAAALRGVSSTQVAPLDTIPLDTIPLDTIGFNTLVSSPLDTIPLDTIGISATLLQHTAVGTIPLDTIALPGGQTWENLLAGTLLGGVPINTLSLLDVATSAPTILHALHLSDVVNSPLDTITLAAAALTTVPLDTIPIKGSPAGSVANETDWCNLIHSIPGFAGFDCTNIGSQTVLGLEMHGVPLDTIPLDTIPLDTIDLRGTPLDTIPLDTIGIDTIRSSPLDTIPLDTIDYALSPLDTIPLDTIPLDTIGHIVDCSVYTCTGHTLGDAFLAGVIKPGAVFGDVGVYPGVTLGNLGRGLPPSVTLHDLLALLIAQAYDWETLPLTFPVQDYSTNGGMIGYTGTFTVTSTVSKTSAEIAVKLIDGERYAPGTAKLDGISIGDPNATQSGGVETLSWLLTGLTANAAHTLAFQAHAGLALGIEKAVASIAAGPISSTAPVTSVNVGDTFEPNDSAAGASQTQPGLLKFSYITSASDRDYYTMPVPAAGVETKIFLSHLPADYDLVVYGPQQAALRAAPLDTIPLDTIAANDPSPTLQQQSQDLSPESLQDVPVTPPSGQSLLGVSDVRGTGDEEVDLVSTGGGGTYTIEVVGYNGAFSNQPYMLRDEQENPRALPACLPRTMGSGGTSGTMPQIPANVDTLFLMNEKQFGDLNGSAAESQVVGAINSLLNTSNVGFVGALIPVESDGAVAAAYGSPSQPGTWNQNPCDPALANNVVRSIIAMVDGVRSTHAGIKNIVLVGGDDEIPMARLADPTPLANEADYASTFGFSSNNEFVSSFANHYLMSDDAYGDVSATTYSGGQLYVPEQAVGRVVDTPDEIVGQLNKFALAHGQLAPSTELTTAYSFLYDGGVQEAAALKAPGRTTLGDLLSPPSSPSQWTLSQLTAALFPTSGTPPMIDAVNAHYNQRQLLPADQSAAHKTDELYTTAMLAAQGPSAVQNRLALTIGCHSGVNAPNTLFSGTAAEDWAQTWVGHGAFGFIGNTGYGLGDDVTVAYSEQLHVDLAKRLDGSLTLGQALIFAKQDYVGGLGQVTSYDAKVINESTLYGLPMWRLGTGTPAPPPAPGPTFTDPSTGNQAQAVSFAPTFTRNDTAYGTYFTVNGESVAESRRPIEPSTSADVTEPNLLAHGYLITSLASTDENIDAAFSRPVDDNPTAEPELVGLVNYPTKLQAIRTISAPDGRRQRLVLTVGQYFSDGIPDASGAGAQRKFTSVGGRVLYADPAVHEFAPPALGPVTIDRVGSNVAFTVSATDESGVKRLLVLYLDGATWRSLDLSANGNIWSGAGPIGNETSISYFAQAVDAYGNVAVISDKGSLAPVVAPSQSGAVTVSLSGTGPTNGWYTSAVTATFSAPAGVAVQASLDGSMFQPVTAPLTIDGTGVHTLNYVASDGSSGTVVIPIDKLAPTISIGSNIFPLGSSRQFNVVCSDAGSGIDSCTTTPSQPDTSTAGTKSFSVRAVDRVGNVTTANGTYQVYAFNGFLAPIGKPPALNLAQAGQGVPVKFALGFDGGLSIFQSGFPVSSQIKCDGTAPTETVPTVNTGASSLSYDPTSGTYTFTWKTDKSWAGTCRQLDVRLLDGTDHLANFKFK